MTGYPLGASVTIQALSIDPYPLFVRLRVEEPVTWAPTLDQWLVTSRDIGLEVLRDTERFRTDDPRSPIRDTFGPQMLSTEGEAQRRYKSACAPPFNARAADEARPLVSRVVARALDRMAGAGSTELRSALAAPVALEVIARVLGLPASLDTPLRGWYHTFADALMNYTRDGETRARAHATAQAFRDAIAPRLRAPDDGDRSLLAALARAHPRLLDDEEIGANALIVMFGGIETTEGLIANALWAILTHQEVLARVRASDDDLERAIEESLRWEPAVQTCTRYVREACTLHGAELPAGAVVQCMIGAMNRDPAYVDDPDRFDPWREPPPAHAAFGSGRHFCLGAAMARVEARLAIRALLDRFPSLQLDRAASAPPVGHEFRKAARVIARLA